MIEEFLCDKTKRSASVSHDYPMTGIRVGDMAICVQIHCPYNYSCKRRGVMDEFREVGDVYLRGNSNLRFVPDESALLII